MSTTYTYTAENMLKSATGALSTTVSYDPLGRLAQTSGVGADTTKFLRDGDRLTGEYSASNAVLRRYVHGAGVD